jgi:hypothetical protein
MARQSAESLYEAKTGISWLEAVNQSARLQLKAVDAHANYVGAYGTAGSEIRSFNGPLVSHVARAKRCLGLSKPAD